MHLAQLNRFAALFFLGIAPLAIAAFVLGYPSATPASSPDRKCERRAGDRIRASTDAVLLVDNPPAGESGAYDVLKVYGCARAVGWRYRVDRRPHETRLDVFGPAGTFVATAAYQPIGDTEDNRQLLTMMDLKSGRVYRITSAVNFIATGYIFRLKLKANGSLAYLIGASEYENRLVVCEIGSCYDRTGLARRKRTLDEGIIPPGTIRLRGSRLTWKRDGQRKSYTLR